MPGDIPIIIPHESVNDEFVRLVRWLAPDGALVEIDQAVAEVEGSKATFPVLTHAAGQLIHAAAIDAEVAVGAALAYVRAESETLSPPQPPVKLDDQPAMATTQTARSNGDGEISVTFTKADREIARDHPKERVPSVESIVEAVDSVPDPAIAPPVQTRFSEQALERIREYGIDASTMTGSGMVRESDVLRAVGRSAVQNDAGAIAQTSVGKDRSDEKHTAIPLSRQKRTEARYLRRGATATLPSLVSVIVPGRGIRSALKNDPESTSLTALVIFEVSRLLRRYPNLNAFYSDDMVCRYSEINVGFAIDGDHGLKVPVLRNADQKTLSTIVAEVRDHVLAYVQNALKPEHLAHGTFTISDLSGEGVLALTPLINQDQSAILGIGAEVSLGNAEAVFFTLSLAFDHQLTEGLTAARFLNELSARLQHHESTLRSNGPMPACGKCYRTVEDLRVLKAKLLQSVNADRSTDFICTLCVAGF